MIWFAFILSLVLGLGSLALSFARIGQSALAISLGLFGLLWLYSAWRRLTWISTLGIFLSLGLAAFGLWSDLSSGWMLAGALGGLMSWDLADFIRRLWSTPDTKEKRNLERRHLARLTIVAVFGLILASIVMVVRLEFSFEWVVLLTLVAMLGISQMIAWLRRRGD